MQDRRRIAAEVALIALLAAAVAFVPGGRSTAAMVQAALSILFAIAITWVLVRLYRQRGDDLEVLGDRRRGLLYGALAVLALDLAAHERLGESTLGRLAFWFVIGFVLAALVALVRSAQRY